MDIRNEITSAIERASDYCHNSRDWWERDGAWSEVIEPMIVRLEAEVARLRGSNSDDARAVMRAMSDANATLRAAVAAYTAGGGQ